MPPWSHATLNASPHAARGFTLLELLVAAAIVSLLAATATGLWRDAVARGARMQAKAAMVAAMLDLERHATTVMSFAPGRGDDTPDGTWPAAIPPPPARPRYWLRAASCPHAGVDDCVELRAMPVTADAACGILILRSSGEWLATPMEDSAPTPLPPSC